MGGSDHPPSGLASSEVDIELGLVAEVVTCKERKQTAVRLDTKQTLLV